MTSTTELARPAGVAFRPVASAQPVSINLPAVRATPAIDLLRVGDPTKTTLEINCREAIGPDLAKAARDLAYATTSDSGQPALYDRLRNSSVALRQLGIDTLEETNRVVDKLFKQENFDALAAATNLLRGLRRDMRKLTTKTGLNTMTILKFRDDYNCERHAIINGRLMTWRETSSADFKEFIKE